MNEFQAAMGLCNLRHVDDEIALRRHVHDRYMDRLDGVEGLRLPPVQPGVKGNYAYFPVVFAGGRAVRDAVCEALDREGVYARKYFYPLVTDFECYRGRPRLRHLARARRPPRLRRGGDAAALSGAGRRGGRPHLPRGQGGGPKCVSSAANGPPLPFCSS